MLVPATTISGDEFIGGLSPPWRRSASPSTRRPCFGIGGWRSAIVVDDAIVIVEVRGRATIEARAMTPHGRRHQGDGRACFGGRSSAIHSGADVGVPAGSLRARPHRQDVRAIRAGHRRDPPLHQRQSNAATLKPTQCAMLAAGPAHAAGEAQTSFLPRLQQCLPARWETAMAWLVGGNGAAMPASWCCSPSFLAGPGRLGRRAPARGPSFPT